MSGKRVPRSWLRRMGERAFGLVLLAKVGLIGALVALLVVAGGWTSFNASRDAMLSDRERGTLTVEECAEETCTGTFVPSGAGDGRRGVAIERSVTHRTGERLSVAMKPGTKTAVRTGPAGVLHAWVPFGGALFLAAVVLAGGLGLRRTGWAVGITGVALIGAAFATL